MYKLIDTINIDFDDNYDLYEYDHNKHKYNMYSIMKNILTDNNIHNISLYDISVNGKHIL